MITPPGIAKEAKRMIANKKAEPKWKQGYVDALIWVLSHWLDGDY